ncbi:hypothetical protein M0M57_10710 [Flavobacterium azooxidireducens]|uniref:DUF4595 domain-containing protein n=1 Tax=Flavobacterium azooxidireducens TaxID=1871076 RepID=A0ABY4KBB9_9FLAO|nr:hypothetical protein [Flavobacterium azooxidireducens]UPQ78093.1 hypothetical protein M0M57_10710 [Flavobacterium azooxidireducens]
MKKIKFLIFLSIAMHLLLTSCSNDDENPNEPMQTRLVNKVSMLDPTNNVEYQSYNFEYNEDFSIKSIEYVNASNTVLRRYVFEYTENNTKMNILSVTLCTQTTTELNHQDTILTSLVNQGNTTTFTYDEQTDMYMYSGMIGSFEYTFSFDEYNNLSNYFGTNYTYDYSKKGILFNVPNPNKTMHFFSNYLQGDSNLKYIFTSKPLTEVTIEDYPDDTISFTNEYDNEGFLIKTVATNIGGNNSVTMYEFNYSLN